VQVIHFNARSVSNKLSIGAGEHNTLFENYMCRCCKAALSALTRYTANLQAMLLGQLFGAQAVDKQVHRCTLTGGSMHKSPRQCFQQQQTACGCGGNHATSHAAGTFLLVQATAVQHSSHMMAVSFDTEPGLRLFFSPHHRTLFLAGYNLSLVHLTIKDTRYGPGADVVSAAPSNSRGASSSSSSGTGVVGVHQKQQQWEQRKHCALKGARAIANSCAADVQLLVTCVVQQVWLSAMFWGVVAGHQSCSSRTDGNHPVSTLLPMLRSCTAHSTHRHASCAAPAFPYFQS
jgi:hypothetical protein